MIDMKEWELCLWNRKGLPGALLVAHCTWV